MELTAYDTSAGMMYLLQIDVGMLAADDLPMFWPAVSESDA